MKKIIFLFLMCFSFINTSQAYTGEQSRKARSDYIKHQDELLEFLLQIPFELRQYVYPMFHENKMTPKKIKTHPDILVWKGKRPTRIAKRFQNDPELLEFLPAQFYYFLAPEMWPEEEKSFEGNPNQLFINFMKNTLDEEHDFSQFTDFKNSLEIVNNSLSKEQKNKLKTSSKINLTQIIQSNSSDLDQKLKKQGYDSSIQFAQKVDKIASIYRQYKKGEIPTQSTEQEFVKDYFSLIPPLFQKNGLSNLLDTTTYSD